MLSASLAFHRLFADNPADLRVKATLTLADATLLNLEGEDFMEGGFSFSQASSTESAFVIGAATVGSFDCTLNNIDGKFDEYDFTGAEIVPYVGVELAPGNVEWLCKGRFWVEQPDSYGNTIGLSCVDNMTLLEKPYSDVNTIYPASLQSIVTNICTACGIVFASPDFPNKTYVVETRPDDGSLTCLQVVSYVAQLACSWACVDTNGRLALRWYRTDWMDDERWLDGGTYDTTTTPYSDGDAADGGSFHSGGANVDGGSFDVVPSYAILQDVYDLTIATDDVVITGVKVTASGGGSNDGESSLYGADGYVLEVAGNPLILLGMASTVAGMVGPSVVGMSFRPFRAQADVDPTVEAGDPVMFADAKGNYFKSFVTSCRWSVTGNSTAACNAETPARNSAATYSAVTAAIVANRKAIRHELTAREAALLALSQQLAGASGFYTTSEEQSDGSTVFYMHDQPTLAQSMTIWKATSDAFGVSTDGGQTYSYGVTSNGVAILNQIYTIGLNADYIVSGALTITDGSTTVLSADADTGIVVLQDAGGNYWNMHSGEFRMAATAKVGNQTLAQYIDDNVNLTQSEVFNALTNNGALQGLYMSNGNLYINASYIKTGQLLASLITTGKIQSNNGKVYFDLDNNELVCDKLVATDTTPVVAQVGRSLISGSSYEYALQVNRNNYADGTVVIHPADSSYDFAGIRTKARGMMLRVHSGASSTEDSRIDIRSTTISIETCYSASSGGAYVHVSTGAVELAGSGSGNHVLLTGATRVTGSFTVSGTKSRQVTTESYADRLLYAYETPTPMFGDLGSGEIGEDGLCYVEIDDIFSETARTDIAYQVFLQACGRGELWVEEKVPTHFVVAGTPGLKFDWELKAKQADYEHLRLENRSLSEEIAPEYDFGINAESAYADELRYIEEQERSLYEAA